MLVKWLALGQRHWFGLVNRSPIVGLCVFDLLGEKLLEVPTSLTYFLV